ncbi:hypothetical protein AAHA92_12724 [Salvia divinorum]|uniref:Uncharacterized protein n=1 Tax=Salvia divinorum TaxID=28513 RepID=A0ABD1HL81_SALDI
MELTNAPHWWGISIVITQFPLDPTQIDCLYGGPVEVAALIVVFRFEGLLELQHQLLSLEKRVFVTYQGNE